MKWLLFMLAVASLVVCWQLGQLVTEVQSNPHSDAAASVAVTAGYTGGAMGAGLIGAVAALGAGLIQALESRRRD